MVFYYDSINPSSLRGGDLDELLSHGWYRMHQSLFTTSHLEHDTLYRVHWLRYPLDKIVPTPTHRRIRHRSRNFSFTLSDFLVIPDAHKILYAKYRSFIDFDGPATIEYSLFGDDGEGTVNIFNTKIISVYDGDKLIAGGYFDLGSVAGTSILHFFDPDYRKYSLGKYLMLITVDYLRTLNYQYYYPGYVVAGLSKMDYKLFVGKDATAYYDPETDSWNNFHQDILAVHPDDLFLRELRLARKPE